MAIMPRHASCNAMILDNDIATGMVCVDDGRVEGPHFEENFASESGL